MATRSGRLEGKVALITRGGYGFGAGIVEKFIEEGARVLIVDHSISHGQEVAQSQPKGTAIFCHADVTKAEDWKKAVDRAVECFGKLDIVVNNAGAVHRMMPSLELPEQEIDRVLDANIKTLYHCVRTVTPYFLSRASHAATSTDPRNESTTSPPTAPTDHTHACHGCNILNISSISASRPRQGLVFYAGTKSAATAITKGFAAEYAPLGVRVNAIEPVAGDSALVPPGWATAGVIGGRARAPSMVGNASARGAWESGADRSVAGGDGDGSAVSNDDAPSLSSQAVVSQGIPLGRWATARDVANAASFLCSNEAEFITGVALRVDGGRSLN